MPDLRPLPALAGCTPIASPRIRLSPLPEGTILHVVAGPNAPDRAGDIERLAAEAGLAMRTLSPGQWLLVGDRPTGHANLRRLLLALEPHGSGFDQSHGRVRLRLAGPMAAAVLSKGTAVDLDPAAFPPGQSAVTLFGHITAHLTRLDAGDFEISVLRGFARSLWDDLAGQCAEFMQGP